MIDNQQHFLQEWTWQCVTLVHLPGGVFAWRRATQRLKKVMLACFELNASFAKVAVVFFVTVDGTV